MELYIGYRIESTSYLYDMINFNQDFRFYVDVDRNIDRNKYIIKFFLNRLCYLNDTHMMFKKPKLLTRTDKFYAILNNTYDNFIDVQDILNCKNTLYSLKLFKEVYEDEISIFT